MNENTFKAVESVCDALHGELNKEWEHIQENYLYEMALDIAGMTGEELKVVSNLFGDNFVELCDSLSKASSILMFVDENVDRSHKEVDDDKNFEVCCQLGPEGYNCTEPEGHSGKHIARTCDGKLCESWGVAECGAIGPLGFICTEPVSHDGEHIARDDEEEICEIWEDEKEDMACCREVSNGYVCSRKRNHSGEHIAQGIDGKIYKTWD